MKEEKCMIRIVKDNIVFDEEDIVNFYNVTKRVGEGCFGLVRSIDDDTLIKAYKEFFGFSRPNDLPKRLMDQKKQEEIAYINTHKMKKSDYITMAKERLSKTKYTNDLILGCALYNDFAFGAILKKYNGYRPLNSKISRLSVDNYIKLMNNIDIHLEDLFNNYIYPTDLKESNILFNDELDVKLIDLDDEKTSYCDTKNAIAEAKSINNLEDCLYRVRRR